MPAKPKYTREEVIDAAYEIARESDMSAITAREVGKRLHTSSSPIFTVFECMEQLKAEVWKKAVAEYRNRLNSALEHPENASYKQIGIETVRFAVTEPNLFRILFVRRRPNPMHGNIEMNDNGTTEFVIRIIRDSYGLSDAQATKLHNQVWFYTLGLAVSCMNGLLTLTEEQTSELLSWQFLATLNYIKSEYDSSDKE